jgi:autotransporter-associated beta strand protein
MIINGYKPAKIILLAVLLGVCQTSRAQTSWAAASSGNWNIASSWSPAIVPVETTNAVISNSGTFTVTYNSTMAATSIGSLTLGLASSANSIPTLTITAGGFNVAGSTTMTGTSAEVVNVNSGGVMTNTTLSLGDYNAVVNVSGIMTNGATQVGNAGTDGNGALKINSGAVASLGTLTVGRNNESSSYGLQIAGGTVSASSIIVGNRNSYATMAVSGGTVTNAGSLQIGTGSATAGREVRYYQTGGTVGCVGTVDIAVAASYTTWFSVLNSASTLSAAGIRIFPNAVSSVVARFTNSGSIYLGATGFNVLNSGTYTVSLNSQSILGANADWTGNVNMVAPSGTFTFKAADANNSPHNVTLTGALTGGGSLAKTGGGSLALDGANTYTGSTTVSAGLLLLGNAGALPKGTALTLGGSGTAGVLDLAGFNAQISGLASGGVAASQIITNSSAANTSTLTFSNSAANSTFGGVLAGGSKPIALTILGGNLTLSGQNACGGNLFISNGALALSGAGSTFTGAAIVLSNSTAALDISGMGGISLGAGQNLSGYGVITGSVTAANCPVSPGTVGTAGTLSFSNNLTLNGGVTNHFDLALDPASAGNDLIIVAGALNVTGTNTIEVNPLGASLSAGTYKLIKFGSLGSGGAANFQMTGTLGASLQSTISVTGTEVDLIVSAVGGTQRTWVGDGSINAWDYMTTNWLNSGTLDVFSDGNFVSFDDTGSVNPPVNLTTTLQPAAVLVNAAANYTFSGSGKISGAGALTKTNSGALTILTANDYSGVTIISQGVLQLGNGAASGSIGTNVIQDSGSLVFNLPGSNNFANVISGAGNLVQAGSGTLTLTASNSYSGGTTISNGTLQLNTGAWFGGGNVTNNGTLVFNNSGNTTLGAVISGTGSVVLTNGGTLTLTGNNTYSGGTMVNKGTLLVNNSTGSGVGVGAVTVASGSTLGGVGVIGGAVTINSGGIFAPGNPVGTLTVSNHFTAGSGAILNYTLGTSSDRTIVSSNLNLSGTLNVTAGSGFTSGTFALFSYGGALTLGSLGITMPANSVGAIDTNTPGLVNLVVAALQTNIPAFPGALGFGAGATGARIGGSVYHVTTLADSGTGSFRDAVSHSGRFVVFDVGGTITLSSVVSCSSGLTIAGQTAPGDGIAIIGHEVSFSAKQNEIVRYLRIRPYSASDGEDGINVGDGTNMIFDHISLEISPYNNIDAHGNNGSDAITVQNSIIADPAYNGSSHKQGFGAHTEHLGGKMAWYYNLWVSEHNRQPLAKIDTIFVNNTEYNFQAGYTVADTSGNFRHDIINNYFITGPTDPSGGDAFFQMNANQSIYSTGNLRDNNNDGALNGSSISPGGGGPVLSTPWSSLSTNCTVYSTASAARYDISWAGAMPHDQLDDLVVSQVKTLGNGTAGYGVGTAGPGGSLYNNEGQTGLGNGGFGVLNGGIAPLDTDQDGMPDYWEQAMGSNPNVADSLTPGTGGYTKLENYLNWLAGPHAVASKNSFVDVDLRQYTGGFTNVSLVYAAFAPTNGTVALLSDGHTAEFTAAGNFSGLGSFNFYVHASDGTAMTNTVSVLVMATGASQNLTWHGDGVINNWDTSSTNWLSGTNLVGFGAGDNVTFDDTGSNSPAINLVGALAPASVNVAANQNYALAGSGSLAGSMALAKSDAGILTIGTSNAFTGGTFVQGGTIVMGNAGANAYGLGTGTVTLNDGTRLNLFDAGTSTDAGTLPNNLVVSGNTTLELPERGGAGGSTLTGSGNFNLITHYVRGTLNYDCSGFSGTLNVYTPDNGGADFRMGSYAGFAGATVDLSNNINAYFTTTISPSGNTVDFGQINAPASATLRGGPTGGRAIALRIGALGTDSGFAGSIVEQTVGSTTSLIKIGAGTLTLGGANSYSGQTIVSNGTLVVNGSTGTNTLTVVSGTLGGSGAIGGGAALYSGTAIAPGADINPGTVGTLTITNGLALTNATLYFDLAGVTTAGGVNDLISLSGGVLVLTGANTVVPNLLTGNLAAGVYTLISGGSSTAGNAANLVWAGETGSRQTFSFDTTTTPGSVLLDVVGQLPATLVWSGTNGSAWDTSTTNWLNGGAADKFYNFDTVIFDDTSTNGNVAISGTVQPAQVLVTNSILNYTIGGGVLGGAAQLVKNGSGTLFLSGSNSFSGGTTINGGTVFLTNDVANQFGLGAGSVTLNNGTLAMYDNAGTYNSSYWNLVVPVNSIGTLNADSRCDLYGSLTGGGTLNFNVPYVRTSLYGDWSAFAGSIYVTGGGEFRVLNFSSYPGVALNLSNNVTADFQGAVDPAGTTLQIGALSGVSSSLLLGGPTAGNVFTWQIGGQNTDATFYGVIAEQGTNTITAIEKIGTGTWTLSGSNTFVGGMTVSAGTLRVNNTTGSATGTNQVFVATGATLSGTGIIGGLTAFDDDAILAPGNGIGTLTISNELDLSDQTVLQFGLGTASDKVVVSGNLTLGGLLNITNTGGFGVGTYTLFTYGGALTFGNLTVASAPVGFVCTVSTNTAGQINLVVTLPQFGAINAGADGLVMGGSGGPPDGNYYVLGSTNVALPLNLWTRIATNQFDSGGNFNFTNAPGTNAPQSFYLLQLP